MNTDRLSPLEIYINKVFKFLIVFVPSMALCAAATFTALHLLGYYPEVKAITMVIFDCTCVIYVLLGLRFRSLCEDENGQIKPDMLKKGKIAIAILMLVQWNFISYMIPSRDFWAYSFFFVLLGASFLDSKYILILTGEIVASMLVSWVVRPELMLPVQDALFIPEMALRFILLLLCFVTLWQLILAVEKRLAKELERTSDYDILTLLYNRRKLEKSLEDAVAHSEKGGSFSVMMADIDDFKQVNDTYGHSCGDEVLKNVAMIMRNVAEGRGLAFRYGGEEMLVLIYAGQAEAAAMAEKIRRRVAECVTVYEEHNIKITLTLGVAEYAPGEATENLINRADANLYYGKNHGKNCVIQ